MDFYKFISQELEQQQQNNNHEIQVNDGIEDVVDLNTNLNVSQVDTSDEEQLYEEYFKEKPQLKATYDEIYEKLKQHSPPTTELEFEQLQIIAELQAKVIVQEMELLILKRIHQDFKNQQTHQATKIEQLQKEKDVMTQMKIGYDKKFQKLDDKRKVIDQNQRTIKQLALSTSNDYLESAIKRVNQQVKINQKVEILSQQTPKANPQIRKISGVKQSSYKSNSKK